MWRRVIWRSATRSGSWSISQLAKIRSAVSAEATVPARAVTAIWSS
jgi:hypothetical protein